MSLTFRGPGPTTTPPRTPRRRIRVLPSVVGWAGFAACALFGLYGLYAAVAELLSLLGVAPSAERTAPPVFVVHALTGAVALTVGALQLRLAHRWVRSRPGAHRALGRAYVVAATLTAAGGLVVAAYFDVGWAPKVAFAAWSLGWAGATVHAWRHAVGRRFDRHRAWMIRSYALASVFVTFSLGQGALAAAGAPRDAVYLGALLIGGALNLTVAEVWVRR
jgi:hypothetical protein